MKRTVILPSTAAVTAVAACVDIPEWLLLRGCEFLPREGQTCELSVRGTILLLCSYVSGCQVQAGPSNNRVLIAWQRRLQAREKTQQLLEGVVGVGK